MEQGWDPDVKVFLIKVLNSISIGLLWLLTCSTAGIYYKLGFIYRKPAIYPVIFYLCMLITLILLVRYLIKLWKSN